MTNDETRRIFFPFANEKTNIVKASGQRFSYYTSADTAVKILQNREIWMRDTSTMNDFMEVEQGIECLTAAYKTPSGSRLRKLLDTVHPGTTDGVVDLFNAWLPGIRRDTYITCLSEHQDQEDDNGRLSMWRAYGRNAGVALILNPNAMFLESTEIGVFSSPVAYHTQEQTASELERIANNIEAEIDLVKMMDAELLKAIVFNMFRFSALCTKHPGFAEEREWRVIASPTMHSSPLLQPSIEVVGGTPQIVQKLKLNDIPEKGITGLKIGSLLNRIIVGPCEHPDVVWRAFTSLLKSCGLSESGITIHTSQIPLRM